MRETAEHPSVATLERLSSLHDFSRVQLQELANQVVVSTARKGECLIERGSNDSATLYLLEGRLQLTAVDGAVQYVSHQDSSAKNPVARLRPSQYEVKALTPVSFLRIPAELVAGRDDPFDPSSLLDGYEVSEEGDFGSHALENELSVRLYEDLNANRLLLPSLPDVAVRVGEAVSDEDGDARSVARVVEADPAISAKLLKAANSARYGGRAAARTVEEAVVRLGLRTTHQLVVTFALRELFRSRSGLLRERMHELWDHSCRVAALCHVLARKLDKFDPDFALLAGLVHDIGAVAVLAYASDQPDELLTAETLDGTLGALRGSIGSLLLKRWDLPAELAEVAEHAEDWQRRGGEQADYVDLVIIAQLHSYVGSERHAALPAIETVPAYAQLGLGALSPQASLQILDEAKDEIRETEQLLGR
jgi:HD-like signal output (HDOD) protein